MNEFKETKIKPGMCLQQLWELEKDVVFCLVTSVGQRKKFWVPMRNQTSDPQNPHFTALRIVFRVVLYLNGLGKQAHFSYYFSHLRFFIFQPTVILYIITRS